MEWLPNLADPQVWIAFATLTALEIVLGIDNIVFISILADKLHPKDRDRARRIGLMLAMLMRIALLLSIWWVIQLTHPLFTVLGQEISGKDIVLLVGGLFLIAKSTHEIHGALEGSQGHAAQRVHATFLGVILQVLALDLVFSLDSVITAVGMTDQVPIMIAAVVIAVAIMLFASGPIARFVANHPTVKMLALSFLILIGVLLVAEGLDQHLEKGYVYFAMAFSLAVEMLNLRVRKAKPVELHSPYVEPGQADEAAAKTAGILQAPGTPPQ
jgi:predicted tellurium resistance membrane protein TerC